MADLPYILLPDEEGIYESKKTADLPYILTSDQEEAIGEIKKRFEENINPVCALPTGTGKTIVACSLIKSLIKEDKTGFLIIAKANNLRDPWINELEKFSIPYTLIHGPDRNDRRINGKYLLKKDGVLLASHQIAVVDIDYFVSIDRLSLLIIDEIHISNNSQKLTRATKTFAKLIAERKLFLTATPIGNSKYELGLLNILLNKPELIGDTAPYIDKEALDSNYQDVIKNNILIPKNTYNMQKFYPGF